MDVERNMSGRKLSSNNSFLQHFIHTHIVEIAELKIHINCPMLLVKSLCACIDCSAELCMLLSTGTSLHALSACKTELSKHRTPKFMFLI